MRLDLQSFLPRFAIVDTARHADAKRAREMCAACAFRRIRTAIPIHIGQVFRSLSDSFSERSDAVRRFIRG